MFGHINLFLPIKIFINIKFLTYYNSNDKIKRTDKISHRIFDWDALILKEESQFYK